ncbi:pyroglutamyl-peptidase I [Arcanobacterium haemolyticum]|nr:pyroglutamyl-peptidase I [Arcanobacterium haemolyticum]
MRFLVTGFEPFAGGSYNPTQAAVTELELAWSGGDNLMAVVLPVEFREAQRRLTELIRQETPDVVLCCGLNAQLEHPVLERVAHNEMRAGVADNAGYQPEGVPVENDGPDRLMSTLPVDDIVERLIAEGYGIGTSDDAGRYVCNATLYRALTVTDGTGARAAFFHIPDDEEKTRAGDDARLIQRILELTTELGSTQCVDGL